MEFLAGNQLGGKDVGAQALQHGGGQGPGGPTSLHVKTDCNAVHGGQDGSGQNNRQSKIDFVLERYVIEFGIAFGAGLSA